MDETPGTVAGKKKAPANAIQATLNVLERKINTTIRVQTGKIYTVGVLKGILKGRYVSFIEVRSDQTQRISIHPINYSVISYEEN